VPTLTPSFPLYRFGIFEANPRSGEVTKKGVRVPLQVKPFQVLIVLLQAQGQIVTRDEIRNRLWPEGTFVEFDDSLNSAVKKLRTALNDSAEHPRFFETVPKVGYRFVAPVSIVGETAIVTGPLETPRSDEASPTNHERQAPTTRAPSDREPSDSGVVSIPSRWLLIVSVVSLLLAILTLAIVYLRRPQVGLRVESIAVLPMENLSGDPQQQYFADGMTDELITKLAKLSSLSVISPHFGDAIPSDPQIVACHRS